MCSSDLSNLTLSKTAAGTVTTNGTLTYTLGLGNSGGTTSGTSATVKDQLPSGVTATGATAGTGVSGVTCTPLNSAGALVTCSVTLSGGLTAGAATGAAAFTVTATAPGSAGTITNYAAVDATGGSSPATPGSSCTTTSCASASTTVQTPPDLTIAMSHTGSFQQGQTGATYTVTASNVGSAQTSGTVTVSISLPAGLSATALGGTGWTCTLATRTCTRADALAGGFGYPAITLTVDVGSSAATPLTPSATVSGGGESNTANDTASDPTVVNAAADFKIALARSGVCLPGQACTYAVTVTNVGGSTSSGTVTVSDTLPPGLTSTSASGAGWSCVLGSPVTCTRSDGQIGRAHV